VSLVSIILVFFNPVELTLRGKLILPGGRFQEAGSIIWNDGSCVGYGLDDSSGVPAYAFARHVDFCSAAFLLTPRDSFRRLGVRLRFQPCVPRSRGLLHPPVEGGAPGRVRTVLFGAPF
jgi:hypothetical protein